MSPETGRQPHCREEREINTEKDDQGIYMYI